MAYPSRSGRRPEERASKAGHHHIIKDEVVRDFCENCELPAPPASLDLDTYRVVTTLPVQDDPIRYIIAVDGGYTEVVLRKEYPSSTMAFFQFGALIFSVSDLEAVSKTPFILPEQMAKLKNIQRFKLALPTKAVVLKGCKTLTEAVRKSIYEFTVKNSLDEPLIATLCWLIFHEYEAKPAETWELASCPACGERGVALNRSEMGKDFSFCCTTCKSRIVLTDVFRLHEAVDDELGAGGILGYVVTLMEQLIVAHLIRVILKTKPALLKEILFVKDGPLAFFGQTANMHKPMRRLINYLFTNHELFLVGSEKTGAFVDHADVIAPLLSQSTTLLLDNEYIHRYIIPGRADAARPYGITTYYGSKVIHKTAYGKLYVLTFPTATHLAAPKPTDFRNLDVILANVSKLRCDMYDNALIPVALVNKLVSLSDHPSAAILEKFARHSVTK